MKKLAIVLALASTSAFAAPNSATPSFDNFAVSAGQTEHDFDTSTFLEFSATKTIHDGVYLVGNYSNNAYDEAASEDFNKFGVSVGAFHKLSHTSALYGEAGFNNLKQEDIMLDDFVPVVKLGYKSALSKKVHVDLNTSYNFNDDFSDHYEVEAGLDYMMTDFLSAGLKVKFSDSTDDIAILETETDRENGVSGTTFAATIKYHF